MIHSDLTHEIIGAAIDVHKELGPGENEAAYEEALCLALEHRRLEHQHQRPVSIVYKGCHLDCGYRIDILVAAEVVVEVKAVESLAPIHYAQLLTYMKLDSRTVGLLLNFRNVLLRDGLVRRVLDIDPPLSFHPTKASDSPSPPDADIAGIILTAALDVHGELGAGLLRSTYLECLCHELRLRGVNFSRDRGVPLTYLGKPLKTAGRIDLLVAGVPVQVLAVDALTDIHRMHFAALLRHSGLPSGLLFNFNSVLLRDGVQRCFAAPCPPASTLEL